MLHVLLQVQLAVTFLLMNELAYPGSLCAIPGTLAQAILDFIASAPFVSTLCSTNEQSNQFTDFVNLTKEQKQPLPFLSFIEIETKNDDIASSLQNFITKYIEPIDYLRRVFAFQCQDQFSPNIIMLQPFQLLSEIRINDIEYNLFSLIVSENGNYQTYIKINETSFFNIETHQVVDGDISSFNSIVILYSLENITLLKFSPINLFRHTTGKMHVIMKDNPTLILSESIKIGDN